jgi:tRNA-binding EMAP/Myf-like protein
MAGAVLPPGADGKPFEIKVGKLRGVESQGMMCSAKELKISEESSGLMELPEDAPVGQNIRDYLPERPEVHHQADPEQGGLPVGAGRGARSVGPDRIRR